MAEGNKNTIKELHDLNVLLEQQKTLALALNNIEQARAAQTEINANNEKIINELKSKNNDLSEEEIEILKQLEKSQKDINKENEKEFENRKKIVENIKFANNLFKQGWIILQGYDKTIRQTVLNLGMSGNKAEMLRKSFELSAGYVSRLGGNIEDIGNIMTGYADETGRARVLSAEMVKDITNIGKGTGIGIEQATLLGAQFELMGYNAKTTMNYVQGVVDTSERMGVNTTKVLKNINDNFKRLNTYTFQQGVKGFAEMAMYAEKFKVDINQALNAADVARTLEGAIDLTAQLQVMGGEFAKTDPFEMLFLSRNDPAKFTEKIADMTKGVVTFRKMSDGTFEKFISPADRDRLALVAKSLHMEVGELTQIAERQAEIQRMRQQMAGMGLSDKEKKLIEGAAIFNKETGRFEVQVAGHMQDITKLTKEQANAFAKERVSLEERAKQAMTFDDTFKATINSLKTALMPILNAINGVLNALRPITDGLSKISGESRGWVKAGTIFLFAAIGMKIAQKGFDNWMKTGSIFAKEKKEPTTLLGKFIRGTATIKTGEIPGEPMGGGSMSKALGGKGMLSAGAGIGIAAAGIGAGIGAAAGGISLLAKAMSGLDEKQAAVLKDIVKTLGQVIGIGAGVAAAIMVISVALGASAEPLLLFGGGIALIGAGIGIAAAGIGLMGMGLAKLVESSKGAGDDMSKIAGGIAEITLAMGGATLALPGMLGIMATVRSISKHAEPLKDVGNAFANIKAVLSGSKDDFIAVQNAIESISKANIKGGGVFSELANLFNKPLKVEFADKRVALVNDITLEIDGQKFMNKVYNPHVAVQKHYDLKAGKGYT